MKHKIAFTVSIVWLALGLCFALAGRAAADKGSDKNDDESDSQVQRGFEIAPVPLTLKGKKRALVGLGSYIVNAQGGCNDCHTWPNYKPGGDPYLGQPTQINSDHYLAGGRPFGPGITSRNLTPDLATGRPAGLTFDE